MVWPTLSMVVAVYVARLIYHAYFSPLASIPGPFLNKISNLPLNYQLIRGQFHTYSVKLHAKYGEVVRIGYDHISLSSTSDTRMVLATHAFRKGRMYREIGGNGCEPSMFTTTLPEVNKARRRMLGDAFAAHTMRAVEDLVVDAGASALITAWDSEIAKQGPVARVNYYYAFHRMAVDVIGAVAFGSSFNILKTRNADIIDWLHDTAMKLKESRRKIEQITYDSIMTRKKVVSETGLPPRIDVLQRCINAKDPETGQGLTPPQLESELILMLVAGSDTTGSTLTWIVMNLLHNPECYKRVTHEIRSTFPHTSQTISYADAKTKLPYLSAVIYESMRITSPSATMLTRNVPAEGICLSFGACHHNPRLWKNPGVFDPERFLGPDSTKRISDVLTFSTGVRVCIGRNLAMLDIFTALANILRRYDFKLPDDAPYGPHRLSPSGIPVEVPGLSYLVTGPVNPKNNCWVNISLA
ncbi:cytochrome P450 [Linderina pennispora]|uniref:Cytochrome P450 n=1 Tax=Linderina pennispora TaxID=61395 RepID=A0A1Y1W6X8_9FUNG|nr:cytochrome P450 [Linderina pennispora]ORX69289.1 cytochrome P450 [Linderina pennispora]